MMKGCHVLCVVLLLMLTVAPIMLVHDDDDLKNADPADQPLRLENVSVLPSTFNLPAAHHPSFAVVSCQSA